MTKEFGPDPESLHNIVEHDYADAPPLPFNSLLYAMDMEDRRVIETFKHVVNKLIGKEGGVPAKIETLSVQDPNTGVLIPRVIARFEINQISDQKILQLEEVAKRAYGEDINKITNKTKKAATHLYPIPHAQGKEKARLETTMGWYIGPNSGTPNRMHKGLFVYREIGKRDIASGLRARTDTKWFTQDTLYDNSGNHYKGGSYIVEIREGGMFSGPYGKIKEGPYQTDLAETIILTSMVLADKNLPPVKPGLVVDIYHEMNQIGLGPSTELPGLENQIEIIERTLFVPLASPDLTRALKGTPKSVGLIGQVGTGKTQLIKHFLSQNLGVMLVPVSANDFEEELRRKADQRTILPRTREVANKTGKNMVLIIEDLETLARQENPASTMLLNELAGLYNSGYRVLWTTNHPEQFNPQLLEPERLGGKIVFCGLPTVEARKLILEEHLVEESRYKKLPIFDPKLISKSALTSYEARDLILNKLALATPGFTPRFLKNVVIEAINQFMYRIAKEKGILHGLTEADLENRSFLVEDWNKALGEVLEVYDARHRLDEDDRLLKYIKPGSNGNRVGFRNPRNEERPKFIIDE